MHYLAALTLLLTGADHWTTYLCLRTPVQGWTVVEANPIAESLFAWAGLVPGLFIDAAVTLVAVGFLWSTTRYSQRARSTCLGFIACATAYAVVNNVQAMTTIGLSPLGVG